MEYICYKRFHGKGIDGDMNIRRGTELEELEGVIAFGSRAVCRHTSDNAWAHFARNDDGKGLERGDLIMWIKKTLAKRDSKYQDRWNKLWADERANKLRNPTHKDFWIWWFDFYNASIEDLTHIKELILSV